MTPDDLLSDIGEFTLLNDYILPLIDQGKGLVGDDCGFLTLPENAGSLVVTTDAGPKPMFSHGQFSYYYSWGWYTVLANASDLASAGCTPFGISLAVEARPDMKVAELMEYFRGVREASSAFDLPITGGNIKANAQFISNATAFGTLKVGQHQITRKGCKEGNYVISLGNNGMFITSYLTFLNGGANGLNEMQLKKLSGPHPQLREMQVLTRNIIITSASDNSDGILGSLWNIAEKSQCGFELDLDKIQVPPYITECSNNYNINPWNLFLFWGDWQIILTINESDKLAWDQVCAEHHIAFTVLGRAIARAPVVFAIEKGRRKKMNILRNENFRDISYTTDIKSHIDYLLYTELFAHEEP